MTTLFKTFQTEVDHFVDTIDKEIPREERDSSIHTALERYSMDRPNTYTIDVTGTASHYYELSTANFPSWSDGFSRVVSIEYPAYSIAANVQPQYLEPKDWQDHYEVTTSAGGAYTRTIYLYLPNHTPAATETFRVTYTVPYAFSGSPSATDIPGQHFRGLVLLCCHFVCLQLAARYARIGDTTTGADSANHMSKSTNMKELAAEFLASYQSVMGLDKEAKQKAAYGFAQWGSGSDWWPKPRGPIFH